MPSFRKAMSLRPVVSEKHENTWSFLAQNASTVQSIVLILGDETPAIATPQEVALGSIVKWIYVEFNLNGVDNSSGAQVFHWLIVKNPGNQFGSIDPTSYNQTWKKFVIKRGMEMLPDIPLGSGGTVQTKRVFVVKIPPRLRRFDNDDKLELYYKSTSASGVNFCEVTVFKEYK